MPKVSEITGDGVLRAKAGEASRGPITKAFVSEMKEYGVIEHSR